MLSWELGKKSQNSDRNEFAFIGEGVDTQVWQSGSLVALVAVENRTRRTGHRERARVQA